MLDKLRNGAQELTGTASELFENHAYNKLISLVGKAGAERAISGRLQERGITLEKWNNYREVRAKMHANPLGIGAIVNEVNILTNATLDPPSNQP